MFTLDKTGSSGGRSGYVRDLRFTKCVDRLEHGEVNDIPSSLEEIQRKKLECWEFRETQLLT